MSLQVSVGCLSPEARARLAGAAGLWDQKPSPPAWGVGPLFTTGCSQAPVTTVPAETFCVEGLANFRAKDPRA